MRVVVVEQDAGARRTENDVVDEGARGKPALDDRLLDVVVASGDAGAYDANDGMPPPDYSLALSVDSPASDPYITAARVWACAS